MRNLIILISSIFFLFTACSGSTSYDDGNEIELLVEELREATADFNNIDNAIAVGWEDDITGCMEESGEGGMGRFAKTVISVL